MAWYNGWWYNLLSRFAIEPIKNKTMLDIKKISLADNQYHHEVTVKKQIMLHHTAGGSAASSLAHWNSKPDRIATAYLLDRDGTIYEAFDPKFWSNHLGASVLNLEKSSIGIEICSYGALQEKDGKFYTYTGKEMAISKVVKLDKAFRPGPVYKGIYWEAYTPEQIKALTELLPYLLDRFKITMQTERKDFWEYKNPTTLPSGIYSHTTVRKDKIDIFPQKELVDLVYSL